ncbi:glycosyltransferase family 4 protein [Winogradskyella vincentii]|uniref:Glycosyltransferase family 4 protein n=1 Tax=Winogradskyella vincentii TaxID=2877122 RepID=A0ABS7XW42_9FLAO|nr:glycosyltransferase family 4 protein [Winogradskyella vincentii]MCA0151871.1 glycosyltransferase family 4 protein [Winogradskyella vincentii]
MRILINIPSLKLLGGVANHYKGLESLWEEQVKYNTVGRRKNIPGVIMLIYDYIKFCLICFLGKYDLVLLNPSLGKTSLIRDALFLRISKFFNIRTIVFFHGWNKMIEEKINKDPKAFKNNFNKADCFLVLAESFKHQLINWGINKPVFLTTTKVDDVLLKGFFIDSKSFDPNILFLARIEENKGVLIVLEAFRNVLDNFPNATLKIAGDGPALLKAKDRAKELMLEDIEFLGNINGELLVDTFISSSIYVLPTTHGEGMPTSVLEAMAFGLAVISRPVGGLVDFFENRKMGYLIDSLESNIYADTILELLNNHEKLKAMGKLNHEYAKQYFLASKVTKQLERILTKD